jgi:hypothetical protein
MPLLFLCVEAVGWSGFEDRNDALGFLPFGLEPLAPPANRVQTLRAQANGDRAASPSSGEEVFQSPKEIQEELELMQEGFIAYSRLRHDEPRHSLSIVPSGLIEIRKVRPHFAHALSRPGLHVNPQLIGQSNFLISLHGLAELAKGLGQMIVRL